MLKNFYVTHCGLQIEIQTVYHGNQGPANTLGCDFPTSHCIFYSTHPLPPPCGAHALPRACHLCPVMLSLTLPSLPGLDFPWSLPVEILPDVSPMPSVGFHCPPSASYDTVCALLAAFLYVCLMAGLCLLAALLTRLFILSWDGQHFLLVFILHLLCSFLWMIGVQCTFAESGGCRVQWWGERVLTSGFRTGTSCVLYLVCTDLPGTNPIPILRLYRSVGWE